MNLEDLSAVPLEQLLPHRAPMLLLSRALGQRDGFFVAEVDVDADSPFAKEGGVPAWVGLEYLAQATAAFAGAEGRVSGAGPKVGMLLGTREFKASVPSFSLGSRLSIRVRKVIEQANGVSAVEGQVLDASGQVLAQAQLTVIEIEDLGLLGGPQGGKE